MHVRHTHIKKVYMKIYEVSMKNKEYQWQTISLSIWAIVHGLANFSGGQSANIWPTFGQHLTDILEMYKSVSALFNKLLPILCRNDCQSAKTLTMVQKCGRKPCISMHDCILIEDNWIHFFLRFSAEDGESPCTIVFHALQGSSNMKTCSCRRCSSNSLKIWISSFATARFVFLFGVEILVFFLCRTRALQDHWRELHRKLIEKSKIRKHLYFEHDICLYKRNDGRVV